VKCTSCDSHNVQRVQMAYEMGTHTISTTSKGTISGTSRTISSSGGGRQQTELARRLSPPRKRSLTFASVFMLIGLFMFLGGMNLAKETSRPQTASSAQVQHKQKKKVEKVDLALEATTATMPAAELSPLIATFTNPVVLTGLVISLLGIAWSIRNRLWNRRQWPLLFAEWQRLWICNQCGTVFAQ